MPYYWYYPPPRVTPQVVYLSLSHFQLPNPAFQTRGPTQAPATAARTRPGNAHQFSAVPAPQSASLPHSPLRPPVPNPGIFIPPCIGGQNLSPTPFPSCWQWVTPLLQHWPRHPQLSACEVHSDPNPERRRALASCPAGRFVTAKTPGREGGTLGPQQRLLAAPGANGGHASGLFKTLAIRSSRGKGVLPNRLVGRASVPASPNCCGMPNKSGLARTLALPMNGRLDLGNTPVTRLCVPPANAIKATETAIPGVLRVRPAPIDGVVGPARFSIVPDPLSIRRNPGSPLLPNF